MGPYMPSAVQNNDKFSKYVSEAETLEKSCESKGDAEKRRSGRRSWPVTDV